MMRRLAMERRRFLWLAPVAPAVGAWQNAQPSQALTAEQQRLETLRPTPKPALRAMPIESRP